MSKPLNDRIAALKARQEKTSAQISALQTKAKSEQRKRETRRKIVVGGAMLHAMEKDEALARGLKELLARYVGRAVDREVIADLLPPSPSAPIPSPARAFPLASKSLAS